MSETKKENKFPVWVIPVIIGVVILGIVLFVLIISFFVKTLLDSGTKIYQGSWECNNKTTVEIGPNNFDMYDNRNIYVNSTYVANKVEIENNYHKCTIRATATKRIINGREYTGPYTTEYQLVIDRNNKNEMAMMNTKTYSLYKCKRK